MKKLIFSLMVLIPLIYIMSCSKSEELEINSQEGVRMYLSVDPTEALIMDFIQKMDLVRENSEYEGSEDWNYSVDSTVWYLEAALNYKYAYIWQYEGDESHSDLYDLNMTSTQIEEAATETFNIVQIQEAYDFLADELESQYENITADNKFFIVCDIINESYESGQLNIEQHSVLGKANQEFSDLGWKWGIDLGDCDGNHQGMDATDIIEKKLSAYRYIAPGLVYLNVGGAQTQNAGWIYPLDVPLQYGQTNPTQFWDFLLFKYTDQWGNPCLSNSDINWYVNNILQIEQIYLPSNKTIIFTDLESEMTTSLNPDIIWHKMYPIYGESYIFSYPNLSLL